MNKLLLTYHMPEESLSEFRNQIEFVYPDAETMTWDLDTIKAHLPECQAFLAIGHKIDRAFLEEFPNLKAVANMGVGYDNIDWKTATEKGVAVINTPNSVIQPTSELTIAIMLNMLRNIYGYEKTLRETLTVKTPLFPQGLNMAYGKMLGIIGFGRIGKAVAAKAKGLGMKIIYSDVIRASEEIEQNLDANYVSFDALIQTSDIISLHCPYSPENHHMFGAVQFRQMKNSAYLVNAARGPIVEEAALVDAIKKGEIAGAAIDVYEFEPKVGAELAALDHVALSPHIGTSSYDARINMTKEAVSGLISCLNGVKPHNVVNPSVFD